jgi:hypothetical protein
MNIVIFPSNYTIRYGDVSHSWNLTNNSRWHTNTRTHCDKTFELFKLVSYLHVPIISISQWNQYIVQPFLDVIHTWTILVHLQTSDSMQKMSSSSDIPLSGDGTNSFPLIHFLNSFL